MTPDELATAAIDRLLERTLGPYVERIVIPVEEAGALVGIGRTASYEAARTGGLPSLRIGGRLVVPVAALACALLGRKDAPGGRTEGVEKGDLRNESTPAVRSVS